LTSSDDTYHARYHRRCSSCLNSGEITLSERPKQPSLTEIFKLLDEAVAAEGPLELDRDMSLPVERKWP
jgi:hypothetical protein